MNGINHNNYFYRKITFDNVLIIKISLYTYFMCRGCWRGLIAVNQSIYYGLKLNSYHFKLFLYWN